MATWSTVQDYCLYGGCTNFFFSKTKNQYFKVLPLQLVTKWKVWCYSISNSFVRLQIKLSRLLLSYVKCELTCLRSCVDFDNFMKVRCGLKALSSPAKMPFSWNIFFIVSKGGEKCRCTKILHDRMPKNVLSTESQLLHMEETRWWVLKGREISS